MIKVIGKCKSKIIRLKKLKFYWTKAKIRIKMNYEKNKIKYSL